MQEITILAIDDDVEILYTFEELFHFQGWNCVSARGVEQALAKLAQTTPSLILIDYHMPRINGVEGVRRIRQHLKHTPIIVFTVEESQETADAFLAAGANDFALKPIKAPDIVSRIRLHLRLLEEDRKANPASNSNSMVKGLSEITLGLIASDLKSRKGYATANEIAQDTGLAYQTVYRYLQHLTQQKRVEQINIYGKIGRPKQVYRWAGGAQGNTSV